MKKFAHLGVVLSEKMDGMMFFESIKCWGTDPSADPVNKIEYLFFEQDSPMMATPVAHESHVAFQVCDLDAMVANKKCVFGPMEVAPGVKIAFFYDETGLLTEYNQMG